METSPVHSSVCGIVPEAQPVKEFFVIICQESASFMKIGQMSVLRFLKV